MDILNVFNTLILKQIFWKASENWSIFFLIESAKIENASFPYKTAIPEANVELNRMVSTNWTYYKELSFANDYFIFLENLFQF